jgi:hypothetical protein
VRIKEFSAYENRMKSVFFTSACVLLLAILAGRALAGITFYPPDNRLDVGDPPGNSYSGSSSICVDDNGWIYVAWDDGRNNAENHDIYFNSSSNYGGTWLSNDIRVDTDLPGVGYSYMWSRSITCDDNGHVYAAWIDERSGRASYPQDIFFNASANHGQTWMENDQRLNRINQSGTPRGTMPEIACTQNGHVYVTWYDYRWGWPRNRIYLNYSQNYGQTWLENDIHIDNLSEGPGDEFCCGYPDVVCDESGHVYVVYELSTAGNCPGFNRSNDYGVTWQGQQKVDNYNTKLWGSSPRIACDESGHVYVAWVDYRNDNQNMGYNDIYFTYSHDYGATWGTSIRIDTGKLPGSSFSYDDCGFLWMDCDDNGHVYVTWVDRRNGNADIYLNHSSDYGVTWQTPDVRLDTGTSPGYYTSWHPTIACDSSGNVFVVWDDDRNGRRDIYMNYSTNYGSSWQASDIRVDTDNAGYGQSMWPMVATSNGRPFIVWDDLRNCTPPALPSVNADIYFQSYTPVGWTGTVTITLENLYAVTIDIDGNFYEGDNLVAKFYTYGGGSYQDQTVFCSENIPGHVTLLENVSRPGNGPIQRVKLVFVDNEGNELGTIKIFETSRPILIARIGKINALWPFASEAQKTTYVTELGSINGLWPFSPETFVDP